MNRIQSVGVVLIMYSTVRDRRGTADGLGVYVCVCRLSVFSWNSRGGGGGEERREERFSDIKKKKKKGRDEKTISASLLPPPLEEFSPKKNTQMPSPDPIPRERRWEKREKNENGRSCPYVPGPYFCMNRASAAPTSPGWGDRSGRVTPRPLSRQK